MAINNVPSYPTRAPSAIANGAITPSVGATIRLTAALSSAPKIWIGLESITTRTPTSEVNDEVESRDVSISAGRWGKAEGLAQIWISSTHKDKIVTFGLPSQQTSILIIYRTFWICSMTLDV
jgi:hypothetical protein